MLATLLNAAWVTLITRRGFTKDLCMLLFRAWLGRSDDASMKQQQPIDARTGGRATAENLKQLYEGPKPASALKHAFTA